MLRYGSRKIFCRSEKNNPNLTVSFRKIAFEKFVKSRKQFQILVKFIDSQTNFTKIENSLQSENLSKIQKIFANREKYFFT